MKTIISLSAILKDRKQDIIVYMLILLAFIIPLPFKENITSLVLIIVLTVSLLFGFKDVFNTKRLRKDLFFLINAMIFLLFVVGLIYADDFSRALVLLQKKLPFLIFPLILSSINLSDRIFKLVIKSFVLGVVLYTMILWLSLYHMYLTNEILNQKIGLNFTLHSFIRNAKFSIHHAYVGMYFTLAIVFLIHLYREAKKKKMKVWYTLTTVYILLNFSFMAGKISFLFLLISVGVYVVINEKQKRRVFLIVGSFLCIVLLPVLFLDLNWIQSLFSSAMERRGQIFKVAYIASLENLPFGIGTSDIKNELESYYIRFNFKDLMGLGTHNTFLAFTLRYGIIGALAYLGYLFYSSKIAVKTKNTLLLSLLVILFLSSLTEHVFETHRGRFFFIFFLSFLYYGHNTYKGGADDSGMKKNLLNDQEPMN